MCGITILGISVGTDPMICSMRYTSVANHTNELVALKCSRKFIAWFNSMTVEDCTTLKSTASIDGPDPTQQTVRPSNKCRNPCMLKRLAKVRPIRYSWILAFLNTQRTDAFIELSNLTGPQRKKDIWRDHALFR